ncbi:hypothetical protein L202_03500 [Cryptococcus amylolentus CBS 6039]|uniref:Uncharacterized protein n=2 Tax=Cryptococcus amylolentus TaxID=104669 RepID=A0A1E3HT56_9TREE|nr:hypothetical protein L202_03500 [Cryptococcus amylolentus CBS 6039]ODN79543.1 hypothetical protein L202_03500 [Cryptococcus amylolentus CBS 6039]ODO07879.1 hypothetical protein I350_03460 [Cryptococcus amylolentus CBS 6273]
MPDTPHTSYSEPLLTPGTTQSTTLSPSTLRTSLDNQGPQDDVEELVHPIEMPVGLLDMSSLTPFDVKADPVLKSIAQKQEPAKVKPSSAGTGFVARPAPVKRENVGPRMTKAAALRQGLAWDEVKPKRDAQAKSEKEEEEKGVPGYKRTGLNIYVASLGTPSIVPRQTKSSQLRTGQAGTPQSVVKRDPEAIAATNKARQQEEKERRRKSIITPASLGAPSIVPRQTKSSMLRTGVMPPDSVSSGSSITRAMSSLSVERTPVASRTHSSVYLPRETEAEAKARRRSSVQGVRSLGAPSITPRLNRSAMLRAPHTSHASISHPPSSFTSPSDYAASPQLRPRPSSSASEVQSTVSMRRAAPSPGPRPTKSSLLRAAQKALSSEK